MIHVADVQFKDIVTTNIGSLTGSPVLVQINNVQSGSVRVANTVFFLDGNLSSSFEYAMALGDQITTSIYGSGLTVAEVDLFSIVQTVLPNPSKLSCTVHTCTSTIHKCLSTVCIDTAVCLMAIAQLLLTLGLLSVYLHLPIYYSALYCCVSTVVLSGPKSDIWCCKCLL